MDKKVLPVSPNERALIKQVLENNDQVVEKAKRELESIGIDRSVNTISAIRRDEDIKRNPEMHKRLHQDAREYFSEMYGEVVEKLLKTVIKRIDRGDAEDVNFAQLMTALGIATDKISMLMNAKSSFNNLSKDERQSRIEELTKRLGNSGAKVESDETLEQRLRRSE